MTRGGGFDDILRQLGDGESNARRGKLFERLIKRYLETDPVYTAQFKRVWLFADWPGHEGQDTGVDLVAQYHDDVNGGGICAIQTKFYRKGRRIPRGDVSTFLTASQDIGAVGRIFVTTSDKLAPADQKLFDTALFQTHVIGTRELANADVSWPDINAPDELASTVRKFEVRPDQRRAIDDCVAGFEEEDRGKLILPCGVGKTFTALKLAEELVGVGGTVLYLVPSIALLAQAMREWSRQAGVQHRYIGVCSDERAGRQSEDASISELSIPVTTDKHAIARELAVRAPGKMTVVFSTYQSIERISEAQPAGHEFGLIICDEAHRTTGVERTGEANGASPFVMVHSNQRVRAARRLYMTATSRIYSAAAKSRAMSIGQVALYSMDDASLYGEVFHQMTFAEAVEARLLSDYKVLVLNIDEAAIAGPFQRATADVNTRELNLDDAAKLVGCASALFNPDAAKRGKDGEPLPRGKPLLRAISFSTKIKDSKAIAAGWETVVNEAKEVMPEESRYGDMRCAVDHVDGSMNALQRGVKLDWLRASEEDEHEVRVLSNARCLSEGVDVPALDAVLFMQPRRSQVDVVQAVGRVMRRAPGKEFGYVILPIVIPVGEDPVAALDNNKRYEVVWEVLQALRSHDERLEAEINQIDLNQGGGDRISIVGVGNDGHESIHGTVGGDPAVGMRRLPGLVVDHFRARVVDQVGDRQYWDRWATDVADIARTLATRLAALLPADGDIATARQAEIRQRFDALSRAMRASTNEALDEDGAISIVAQHMITGPVFNALYPDYDFTRSNPVARSLTEFVSGLHDQGLEAELADLERFYDSVRRRASGINNPNGRRKVLEELYENFFKHALPDEVAPLGVVYTPHELVDFILHSVNDVLKRDFGKTLADPGVHVLDPFAGMGTFIWRLIANPDLIPDDALERKYREELHANELLPLAYYMATINIEEAYRERMERKNGGGEVEYEPFKGIVWRDTFNAPTDGVTGTQAQMRFMQENDARAKLQDETAMTVIVSNPPYSTAAHTPGSGYLRLRERIQETYGARSRAHLRQSLYDSYKLAFRWSSDRIFRGRGQIGFVCNASYIDGNAESGVRRCLEEEFGSIHVLNLRGNQRTQGEVSRKEGGKVFGSGSRAAVALSVFSHATKESSLGATIRHKSVADFLSREDKLALVGRLVSISGVTDWIRVRPDAGGDWVELSDPTMGDFRPIGDKPTLAGKKRTAIFRLYSSGQNTSRDAWVYDFDAAKLIDRAKSMIDAYAPATVEKRDGQATYRPRPSEIKWGADLESRSRKRIEINWSPSIRRTAAYRPYVDLHLYYDRQLLNSVYRTREMFPSGFVENQTIGVQGVGENKPFSATANRSTPDYHDVDSGKHFPRSRYQAQRHESSTGVQNDSALSHTLSPDVASVSRARNRVICVGGVGANRAFSSLCASSLTDYEFISKGKNFPRYAYEPVDGGGRRRAGRSRADG